MDVDFIRFLLENAIRLPVIYGNLCNVFKIHIFYLLNVMSIIIFSLCSKFTFEMLLVQQVMYMVTFSSIF